MIDIRYTYDWQMTFGNSKLIYLKCWAQAGCVKMKCQTSFEDISILQIHTSSLSTSFTLQSMSSGCSDSDDYEYEYRYDELKFDFRDRVLDDLMKMYSEGCFNDVCIKLHDGEIKAIKSVLAARCEYFAATFRWKSNNNHVVEEIVVNDCSKKIMACIIEYIFSGVLEAKGFNFLEFLELQEQVRKMFPGDELDEELQEVLQEEGLYRYRRYRELTILPTNEEIAKAISLVETGNLKPEVLVELGKEIVRTGNSTFREFKFKEKVSMLANLVSYGVIETIQYLELEKDLGFLPSDQLQALVSCVTGSLHIINVAISDLMTLLDHIDCKELVLKNQTMNQVETEALVRAMTTRIEIVHLYLVDDEGFFNLDCDTFRKYQGDGKCREIHITNYTKYDLTSLLDSVNCKELYLSTSLNVPMTRELNQKETEALVRAMTSRVEIVHLGYRVGIGGYISLDYDILTKFTGDGKCREVHCNAACIGDSDLELECRDAISRYKWLGEESGDEDGVTWAEMMNWDRKSFTGHGFLLTRKKYPPSTLGPAPVTEDTQPQTEAVVPVPPLSDPELPPDQPVGTSHVLLRRSKRTNLGNQPERLNYS